MDDSMLDAFVVLIRKWREQAVHWEGLEIPWATDEAAGRHEDVAAAYTKCANDLEELLMPIEDKR